MKKILFFQENGNILVERSSLEKQLKKLCAEKLQKKSTPTKLLMKWFSSPLAVLPSEK